MAKLYVFGIGGTGSRVLRSLTMLMAAGVKMDVTEVVPIIIDPDVSNADMTRTVHLMRNYTEIHDSLHFTDRNANRFFQKPIRETLPSFQLSVKDTQDRPFSEFIGINSMSHTSQALVRMLFSEKNLRAGMEVGFKGNPNIGSVVLNQVTKSDDFIAFANSFDQGDKIMIINSIFGGTGASGFPLLLKSLRTSEDIPNHELIRFAEIGGVTILPYFTLAADKSSEIDSTTFISKTKSALAYYEQNIVNNKDSFINALYLLGDDIKNMYENHEGGKAQQNDAHLIEFLAALGIVDFCNHHHNGVTKEFGIKEVADDRPVTFLHFDAGTLDLVRGPMTQLAMMANCFREQFEFISSKELNANRGKALSPRTYQTTFVAQLMNFLESYSTWLNEMKGNHRALDLFNLECGDRPFDLITDVEPHKGLMKLSYNTIYRELNKSVKACKSTDEEDILMEMFYRATENLTQSKYNF